jgi:hypothetical protein
MSKIVLTNVEVKVANVDLSDHCNSVTISQSSAEVETTAFGQGHVSRVGGLKDTSVSLGFHQNYAAGEVEATIAPLLGTLGTVSVIPAGGSVSESNPSYTMEVLFTEWNPIDGSVGDLSTASVTWPANSIAKATA